MTGGNSVEPFLSLSTPILVPNVADCYWNVTPADLSFSGITDDFLADHVRYLSSRPRHRYFSRFQVQMDLVRDIYNLPRRDIFFLIFIDALELFDRNSVFIGNRR